jgi:hypothetical protein
VLLLFSIFIVMVTFQLYLGGWSCSGGQMQKGDEQQRKRAKSVSQFGAIIAENDVSNCAYKKVSSSDNMQKDVVDAPPLSIVTVVKSALQPQNADTENTNTEHSKECCIELIEFSSLPSAQSPQGRRPSNARKFGV